MRQVIGKEIELNGRDLYIEGLVQYHVDREYGADSDGNRGCSRTIIDDVTDITVSDPSTFNDIQVSNEELEIISEIIATKFIDQ